MSDHNDQRIENEFRDLLQTYHDSGVVFQSPAGRAYYSVRSVETTKAAVRRLSSNEDADVNYTYYRKRRELFSDPNVLVPLDDFARTVAVHSTCALGDMYALSEDRRHMVLIEDPSAARANFVASLKDIPVASEPLFGQQHPIMPAIVAVVIQAVRNLEITDNRIDLAWVIPKCLEFLATVVEGAIPEDEVANGFFKLSNLPFWLLAYNNPESYFKHDPKNIEKLSSQVKFATLKQAFWTAIKDDENNESLLDVLAAKYWPTRQPSGTIVVKPKTHGHTNELFVSFDDYSEMQYSLNRKKNIVLQGAPGVGKTFVARQLAMDLTNGKKSQFTMIQFHQSYSYEDFVQGYRPISGGGFERKNRVFWEFCERAKQNQDANYVFLIDEINRGNMSKIFGELLMLIESDKRAPEYAIPLTYSDESDEPFYIPKNVFLIGMMNTADRSLSFVDFALRRRFVFFELQPAFRSSSFRLHLESRGVETQTLELIIERMLQLNEVLRRELGDGYCIGHSFFCPSQDEVSYGRQWYDSIVKLEILPLLNEYFLEDPVKSKELAGKLLE